MEKLLPVAMLVFFTLSSVPVIAAHPEAITLNDSEPADDLKNKLALGESYRDQGSYNLAANEFESVLAQAEQKGDRLMQAMAGAALGYNYYLDRENSKAQSLLEQSDALTQSLNSPGLSALIEDYLGMLSVSLQLPEKAAANFDRALKNARLAQNNDLIAGIRVNQAGLEVEAEKRLKRLENITIEVLRLNNPTLKITLLLNISEQLLAIDPDDVTAPEKQQLLKNTYQTLNNAYLLADANSQVRLRSQAEGYLARLYAQQKRNQDALVWLDKAITDAQQVNATDLSMQWETQSAKLLQVNGDSEAALTAYRRAVKHLTDIRYGLPITLHNGHSSIKEIIEPIYRGLADVLLLQAAKTPGNEAKQKLILEAIDSMETIKQTELEEFFKDRCLIDEGAATNLKDAQLSGVGIIYPVILPDRIELLFRDASNTQFEQKTIAASSRDVVDTTIEMAQFLRQGEGNYRKASRKLYDWLLKSYEGSLKEKGINTLIFVPDGPLRQVPFSALLNGKKFVIEDYAIVTLPGLSLKNSAMNTYKKPRALIAALSKPDGASIDELLHSSIKGGLGERGLIKADDSAEPVQAGAITDQTARNNLIENLSLPGVNDEVKSLQKDIENTTMLNQSFTYGGFKESVGSGEYSIIHIASHGYFGKSADDSFVMTYDHMLKLGDFQSLLSSDKIKKNPIDLLTLSACQTAAGDDRALLGFSGMAIKTNALSAIGTLWSVDDVATAKFMDVFYSNLTKLSKAQALRQAQLFLLTKDELKHPHYWSPFIMVGNW